MALIEFEDGVTQGNAQTFNYNFNEILNMICPVGKVEVFFDNADHSNHLGFVWERTSIGKVPVGINSSDTDFNTIGKTGGEKTHKLTINEMPSHNHELVASTQTATLSSGGTGTYIGAGTVTTKTTGGNGSHNNLQPYEVMAFWKRVS